jgi:hypothetical protein
MEAEMMTSSPPPQDAGERESYQDYWKRAAERDAVQAELLDAARAAIDLPVLIAATAFGPTSATQDEAAAEARAVLTRLSLAVEAAERIGEPPME